MQYTDSNNKEVKSKEFSKLKHGKICKAFCIGTYIKCKNFEDFINLHELLENSGFEMYTNTVIRKNIYSQLEAPDKDAAEQKEFILYFANHNGRCVIIRKGLIGMRYNKNNIEMSYETAYALALNLSKGLEPFDNSDEKDDIFLKNQLNYENR